MKVVICGGGIIGASVAYYLTLKGINNITIVEKTSVACSSSGKSGGFLAKNWCDDSTIKDLARYSYDLHAELSKTLNIDFNYRQLDTFSISATEKSVLGRTMPNFLTWMDPDHVGRTKKIGDLLNNAQSNPYLLTHALVDTAVKNGAVLRIGTVEKCSIVDNKVNGVFVDGELISADVVVIAMGPWSSKLVSTLGLGEIPMMGYKVHSIVVRPTEVIPAQSLFVEYTLANGKQTSIEVYPRSNGEVYMCGCGGEDEIPPEDINQVDINQDRGRLIHKIGSTIIPSLKDCEILKIQACHVPHTSNYNPVIGKVPFIEGIYIGTGHHCWGILNAPGTGKLLAELITEGKTTIDLSPFDPRRYLDDKFYDD